MRKNATIFGTITRILKFLTGGLLPNSSTMQTLPISTLCTTIAILILFGKVCSNLSTTASMIETHSNNAFGSMMNLDTMNTKKIAGWLIITLMNFAAKEVNIAIKV